MTATFFATPAAFRKWLAKHHKTEKELIVGFYKVGTGKPSVTWPQSVDQALCFGWIDGVRRSIDEESYCIRFTPRRSTSAWSAVNIQKIKELTKQGLIMPAGISSFKSRNANRSKIYSYENQEARFSPGFENRFKANKAAWNYFLALAPSFRKASKNWVMSAKQETTRVKRLGELIKDSKAGINKWKHSKYKTK